MMTAAMAVWTERNRVFNYIWTIFAKRLDVMNL